MKIGVPRESLAGETRVAITPDVVKKLTGKGFEILIEAGAGESAHFPDDEYSAVGGTLVSNAEALAAEIVVKLRKPSAEEVAAMADGAIYIGLV